MICKRALAFLLGALVTLPSLAGCTKKSDSPQGTIQVGIASWYGHPFHGRPTASGEIYDMEKMTAAHRTLALGTVVRVQNLTNKAIVEVRINDRGPFIQDRIIDLSHAAAQAISMPGIANVRLEVISTPPRRAVAAFAVQIGAFSQRSEADSLRVQMERKYGTATVVFRDRDQTWNVLVGHEPALGSAKALASQLENEFEPTFVVLIDSGE
jgi:rare lipoprotein A